MPLAMEFIDDALHLRDPRYRINRSPLQLRYACRRELAACAHGFCFVSRMPFSLRDVVARPTLTPSPTFFCCCRAGGVRLGGRWHRVYRAMISLPYRLFFILLSLVYPIAMPLLTPAVWSDGWGTLASQRVCDICIAAIGEKRQTDRERVCACLVCHA